MPDSKALVEFVLSWSCKHIAKFCRTLYNYPDLGIPINTKIFLYHSNRTTQIGDRVYLSGLFGRNSNVTLLILKTIPTGVTSPSFKLCWFPFYQGICKAEEQDSWLLFGEHMIPFLKLTADKSNNAYEPDPAKGSAEESNTVSCNAADYLST